MLKVAGCYAITNYNLGAEELYENCLPYIPEHGGPEIDGLAGLSWLRERE
ncbi:MAG: hypothetical protein NC124_06955 [Clostridium sp.]|nr:hypothetical protein [Clostridium sp.]